MDVGDDMDVKFQQKSPATLPARSDADGLTLVELLVVIAVSAILFGIAVPAFSGLMQSTRLTGQINTLVSDLNFSRSEAVKRMRRVILCKSANQSTCDADAHWDDGWIIFPDRNGDGLRDREEPLLRSRGPLPDGYTIRFLSFHTSNYVRYYPDGHTANTGTFTFCSPRGPEYAKAVIIYRGRLRSERVISTGRRVNCAAE